MRRNSFTVYADIIMDIGWHEFALENTIKSMQTETRTTIEMMIDDALGNVTETDNIKLAVKHLNKLVRLKTKLIKEYGETHSVVKEKEMVKSLSKFLPPKPEPIKRKPKPPNLFT
jgi:hypothetical protein